MGKKRFEPEILKRLLPRFAALALAIALAPGAAGAAGRFFGDFSIGAGTDDSVYRDATKINDSYFPIKLGVGWRGRLSKAAIGRAYYNLSLHSYSSENTETYLEHSLETHLNQKLYKTFSLNLRADGNVFAQPNLPTWDTNRIHLNPAAQWRAFGGSAFELGPVYESENYPNFDLDSRTGGFRGSWVQDLGLYARLAAGYRQQSKDYFERKLFIDDDGAVGARTRKDSERQFDAALEGDWTDFGAFAGYSWLEISSDGNFVDFGPNQSQTRDTVSGDETLVENYYSVKVRGPFLGGNMHFGKRFLLNLVYRNREIEFEGRPAKNSLDEFIAGSPKRKDSRHMLSFSLTRFFYYSRLTLGWTMGWDHETSSSNDFLYNFNNNRFFVALRGWL